MSRELVGQVFRDWRKSDGLTFDDASDLLDCGRSTLDCIERGRNYPSLPILCRFIEQSGAEFKAIADACGVAE